MKKIYGYARVSTREQNEDRQMISMRQFGVAQTRIFLDKQSGRDFNRPAYRRLLSTLRKGDTLVIKSIDRLGRNYEDMDTPLVYDAEGKETLAEIVLTDAGEYVRMEYRIDPLFMNDAVYPVTIDPVVHSERPALTIQDTTIRQGSTAHPYTDTYLKLGIKSGNYHVALLKFNILAIPKASDTVIQAVLQMAVRSSSSSKYIGAYEILKPWESKTVDWDNFIPYPNAGNVSGEALDCVKSASSGRLNFDLTNLYRKWCTRDENGLSNNNGVAFRPADYTPGTDYSELYSSDASSKYAPVIYVNYISYAGIEGWWQYEQTGAGRAGTVYTDLFNGNMVLAHGDAAMSGSRNPVSVSHYYNSCLSTANAYGCGFGWKTDAHQKVTMLTLNDHNYLIWEDGDGTEHFFDWSGSQPYTKVFSCIIRKCLPWNVWIVCAKLLKINRACSIGITSMQFFHNRNRINAYSTTAFVLSDGITICFKHGCSVRISEQAIQLSNCFAPFLMILVQS